MGRNLKHPLFCLILGTLIALPASATFFRNSYISFQLPDQWKCQTEGTEWVCFNTLGRTNNKEALIILTAKEAGPQDSLAYFKQALQKKRTLASPSGKPVPSNVQYVKDVGVNNQPWVDSLHYSSEVEAYYTRYLATVKSGLSIAVTFSAFKDQYGLYANDFHQAITSLRVIAGENILSTKPPSTTLPLQGGQANIHNQQLLLPDVQENPFDANPESTGRPVSTVKKVALALLVLSLLGVGYYYASSKKA